ncbi:MULTISPECIES: hypothetical protein [unclassified Pseudoalteromonas]|uniref:hypothetical protein n=1 Tax=unclassified Pseudoalteromonas TaxID=194690 RepID=UPI000CF6B588|nr:MULTISPECIES: hypothetical protein [unclassified Pseudoalteromonas]MBS3799187.1 hypothetical protein [Pseudoalteromonas sp. BDTF-M6]
MRLTLIAAAVLALSACNSNSQQETQAVAASETTQAQQPKTQLKPTPKQLVVADQGVRVENPNITATNESIAQGYRRIHELTADKTCDTSQQCQVVAVGSRACGGANEYVVFSTKTADAEQVKALAEEITVQERQFNLKTGAVSICEHLMRPSTQCQQSQCVRIQGSSSSVY